MAGSRTGEHASPRAWMAGGAGRWALATTLALLAMTGACAAYTLHVGREGARDEVVRDAEATVAQVDRRMQAYGEVLLGVRALLEARAVAVQRDDFAAYVKSLQVEARYPGVQTLAYAPVVPSFDRARFVRATRRTARGRGDRYASFTIRPASDALQQIPLLHLEPLSGNEAALGFDLLSERRRRQAVETTQRNGRIAATAPLRLVQGRGHPPGFLFVLAVRRASGPLSSVQTGRMTGVVTAAFDSRELFDQVFDGHLGARVGVVDAGAVGAARRVARIYGDADLAGRRGAIHREIRVGDRRWAIHFWRAPDSAGALPTVVGGLGTLASLLVGLSLLLLGRGKARAVVLARRMTHDLEVSHAELQRSHDDLLRAEGRVQRIIETAPEGFVAMDDAGRITRWNPESERIFGWSAEEVVGRELAATIVPPASRDAHRAGLARFLETGAGSLTNRPLTLDGLTREGRSIPLELSISAQHEDGAWTFNAFIRDVSERRATEAALREAEERFRRAFEDSALGKAIVSIEGDRPGRLLQVNSALAELLGGGTRGLEGRPLEALIHPLDGATVGDGFLRLRDGHIDVLRADVRCVRGDGEIRWVELTISLVRDAGGVPLYGLCQLQDASERKHFEGQLQHLADHDPLTGLLNRRRFEADLEREVAGAARHGSRGAVLALDLDNFKYVNDTFGHAAGDGLIQSVADLLRGRLRSTDVLARLGGDEFAIILPHADEARARDVAGDIAVLIADRGYVGGAGGSRVTASIGIALFDRPSADLTAEQLLVEADIAMYDAKDAGRDRVALFAQNSPRHAALEARVGWHEQVRAALAEGRFVLLAQPIVPLLATGPPRFELLLRMVSSEGALIPPASFLPVAERSSLIEELDRWVLRQAAIALAHRQRELPDVQYEVNLSGRSIADPLLSSYIQEELRAAGARPEGLMIEVTETAAIVNIDRARMFAREMRAMGIGFALDDFGTGFASFYYLKHLEFDLFKIDGEFIRDLPENHTNQVLVASLVEIARGLGKQTVAECVEDEATLELLRRFGVHHAQGFHIGRPESVPQPAART